MAGWLAGSPSSSSSNSLGSFRINVISPCRQAGRQAGRPALSQCPALAGPLARPTKRRQQFRLAADPSSYRATGRRHHEEKARESGGTRGKISCCTYVHLLFLLLHDRRRCHSAIYCTKSGLGGYTRILDRASDCPLGPSTRQTGGRLSGRPNPPRSVSY